MSLDETKTINFNQRNVKYNISFSTSCISKPLLTHPPGTNCFNCCTLCFLIQSNQLITNWSSIDWWCPMLYKINMFSSFLNNCHWPCCVWDETELFYPWYMFCIPVSLWKDLTSNLVSRNSSCSSTLSWTHMYIWQKSIFNGRGRRGGGVLEEESYIWLGKHQDGCCCQFQNLI